MLRHENPASPPGLPAYIDDSDLTGIGDLIHSVGGESLDVFITSNGGSAEASERIVRLLRGRFKSIRFLVPSNAYSAATLICFSGDEVVMGPLGVTMPIRVTVEVSIEIGLAKKA